MPTKRTGTIEWRDGWAFARVWVGNVRKRVALGTRNKDAAKRMLAKVNRMVDRGELTREVMEDGAGPETFEPFAKQWNDARNADGVKMAPDEKINLTKHVYGVETDGRAFGDLAIVDVRPRHVVAVLQAAIDKGLRKGTVEHIKRMLARIFGAAIAADILPPGSNPVLNAKTPRIPEAQRLTKRRVTLTDDEVVQFFECHEVDLEIRMMSLVARVEGGMRTSDVNRWDWSHIDTVGFEWCKIPRAKVDRGPQDIEIHERLRPFVAAWWHQNGCPASGPVFPVVRGERKGEFRATRGVSYAKRLRVALRKAGLTRPELFVETAHTKPVDFHSFRRAFVTAMAESGVNQQRAMTLSHHSDAKTHQGYLAQTKIMRTIPDEAVPRFSRGSSPERYPAGDSDPTHGDASARDQSGKRDSNPRPSAWEAVEVAQSGAIPVSGSRNPAESDYENTACVTLIQRADTPGYPAASVGEGALIAPLVVVIGAPTVTPTEARAVPGVTPSDATSFGELMDEAADPSRGG